MSVECTVVQPHGVETVREIYSFVDVERAIGGKIAMRPLGLTHVMFTLKPGSKCNRPTPLNREATIMTGDFFAPMIYGTAVVMTVEAHETLKAALKTSLQSA